MELCKCSSSSGSLPVYGLTFVSVDAKSSFARGSVIKRYVMCIFIHDVYV